MANTTITPGPGYLALNALIVTALAQRHFRFRTDAGAADATPTWGAAEDVNYNPGTAAFRLRFSIENPNAEPSGSLRYKVFVSKNGGAYTAVTPNSTGGVRSTDAGSDADDTPIFIPRLTAPLWTPLSGAAIDLDFKRGIYYSAAGNIALTDVLSCIRGSSGTGLTAAGTTVNFAANQLRITDLGLFSEDVGSNNLINSDKPLTQTTASLATGPYTLWVNGAGSALASAGSATITGAASATDGSPNTFTVSVAGTVIVTVTGALQRFQLEDGSLPSSFIPTTGAAATRARDDITVIGSLDTIFQSTAASVVVDLKTAFMINNARIFGVPGVGFILSVPGGGGANNEATNTFSFGIANLSNYTFPSGGWQTGIKIGVAGNAAGRSLVNGGLTVASNPDPFAYTGSQKLGDTTQMVNGYYRRITVWNTRLADATLQALTAS